MADDATLRRLKRQARERGVSFAEVVREALEEKASTYRPRPESVGSGQSSRNSRTAAVDGSERQPPRSWR